MKKNSIFKWIFKNTANILIVLFFLPIIFLSKMFKSSFDAFELSFILLFIIIPFLIALVIFRKINLITYFIGFVIQWIIFLNVNTYPIKNFNKLAIMELIPLKYRPQTQFSLDEIKNQHFKYPIIIKPTICSGLSKNITIINNQVELNNYLNKNSNKNLFMVQNYLQDENVDIKVMWEKLPWNKEGKITEVDERERRDKINEQIMDLSEDIYISHLKLTNKHINNIFSNISEKIPGFNIGRYDIRAKNIHKFINGDFKIIELNGTFGMTMSGGIDEIPNVIKWYFTRLVIGIYNIITLKAYSPINLLYVMFKGYNNTISCEDWEKLYSPYS
jgi:energy-coupling factor transporter transmembrane protein EcfT